MVTIGLTGPSGAGKGVVSDIMRQMGFQVIDADKVYHDIILPPSECLNELVLNFGNSILSFDGMLDRSALASIVFSDNGADKLELLNSITHKYVVNKIRGMIYCTCSVMPSACVIDAPLLIESGLNRDCLFTIGILADKEKRAERIAVRDGISKERALARIDSQKNNEFYISECDYIVYNDSDIGTLRENVISILKNRRII